MKHAKEKASQKNELEKFVANHNKLNNGITIVIDIDRHRIRFNCSDKVKNQVIDQSSWSMFRNRIYFGTQKLLHMITDNELELNFPELNLETTEELFSARGIFICYFDRPFVKNDVENLKWLINFCVSH